VVVFFARDGVRVTGVVLRALGGCGCACAWWGESLCSVGVRWVAVRAVDECAVLYEIRRGSVVNIILTMLLHMYIRRSLKECICSYVGGRTE